MEHSSRTPGEGGGQGHGHGRETQGGIDLRQLLCVHRRFSSDIIVHRINGGERFDASVTITCTECGLPFSFDRLGVSDDGTTGKLTLVPGISGALVPRE